MASKGKQNAAQQILAALGVANAGEPVKAQDNREPSATKRGPGRKHLGGKPGNRLNKAHAMRAYEALMAAWAARRVPKWDGRRDEHGAYTVVGGRVNETRRRKWLAGISAQRGY